MGSLKNPKTWVPYINPKDCSKRICNLYCTKWCSYIILPSPPPPPAVLPEDDLGRATLSPLMIVIIAVIGSFFLLIGCYVIISRYCFRNNESFVSSTRRGVENQETLDLEMEEDDYNEEDDPSNYVPWLVLGKGLDEALIKSITICKYKRGDGLVSSTDCLVCLGEFQEDESIRLLPKCSHAFHVYCIDTWLKTHSNCPLCRENVCCVNALSLIPPSPTPPPPPPPPPPPEITSDLRGRDSIIEIREEVGRREIRRSMSMSYLCQTRASIADVLLIGQDEETKRQELQFWDDAGSSEQVLEGINKGLNFVNMRYVGMKRSFSSGRYLFAREDGKGARTTKFLPHEYLL